MKNIFELSNFDYKMPRELIAQKPLLERDQSRLLVLDRKTGVIAHDYFYNIKNYLKAGDCLVLNDTKVIPARLFGKTAKTGAKIEILVLDRGNRIDDGPPVDFKRTGSTAWEVMMKNSRRVKQGSKVIFPGGMELVVTGITGKTALVEFNFEEKELIGKLWETGTMPLPPYIKEGAGDKTHKIRYQTVYAEHEGAKAAPTAGLHFTKELLEKLKAGKISPAYVTLHVGLGTFEAISEKDIRKHRMHAEHFEIDKKNADIINSAPGRIIACGTTAVRVIESAAEAGGMREMKADTGIFIYPGYEFRKTQGLITNFHLPRTTLFALVCAFAGMENVKNAYNEAIRMKYRFYSYGDAMLII